MPVVLTVDQRASRAAADAVPALLGRLAPVPTLRPFQRTAGDEVQGVLDDADAVVAALAAGAARRRLARRGRDRAGRASRCPRRPAPAAVPAYLHAREAVTRAKSAPHRLGVVGADAYAAEHLETVLGLWAGLLERRTDRGWEVADALDEGLSHAEAGQRLGISQSAVSQRAQAAGPESTSAGRAGWPTHLLAGLLKDETERKEGRR